MSRKTSSKRYFTHSNCPRPLKKPTSRWHGCNSFLSHAYFNISLVCISLALNCVLNLRSDNRFFDVQTRPFFTTLSISLFTRESNRNSVLVKRGNTNLSTISVYRFIKTNNGLFVSSSFSSSSSSRFRFVILFESIEMKCCSRKSEGIRAWTFSFARIFDENFLSFFFFFLLLTKF